MAERKLAVVITGENRDVRRAFAETGNDADAFDSKMSKISKRVTGSFSTIGKGIGLGLAGGVGLLAAYGPQLVDFGAALGTWELKANTVFESQAAAVRKWADSNNEAFGMTDEELTGLTASFGDLIKPMGFTTSETADMSKKVVGLAGALSQWSGGKVSAAETTDILAKAMLGERDGLVALGIKISDNDVQNRLAAKGQEKLTGAALEQAKALATQELIFEKSTDAQKAFAAGGNKTIMASNKLKAIFGELQVWLAEKLVPAFTVAATWVGDNLPRYIDAGRKAIDSLFGGGQGGDPGSKAQEVFGRIQSAVQTVVAVVRQEWPQIKATVTEVMTTVQEVVGSAVSIVQTIWTNFGDDITTAVRGAFNNLRQIFSGQLEVIRGIFTAFSSLLKGDWSGVWEGLKQIVHGFFNIIVGTVKNGGELLRLAGEITMETFSSMWSAAWESIKKVPGLAWEGIKTAVAWGAQYVVDRVTELPGKIATAASGMFDGIKEAFRSALNWVIDKWNSFKIEIPAIDPPGPGSFPGVSVPMPQIDRFHTGGVVQGRPGTEVPILALPGERVLSLPETRAYDAPMAGVGAAPVYLTVNVQVAANTRVDRELVDGIVLAVEKGTRATGRSPFVTSTKTLRR